MDQFRVGHVDYLNPKSLDQFRVLSVGQFEVGLVGQFNAFFPVYRKKMRILLNLYLSEKGEVYKKGKSTFLCDLKANILDPTISYYQINKQSMINPNRQPNQ